MENQTLKVKKDVLKRIEQLCFFVLIVFAFVGSLVAGTVIHEYSHAYDFRNVSQDEEICGLVLPNSSEDLLNMSGALGYFNFSYNSEDKEIVNEINKYTETKAYTLTMLPILLVCVSIIFVVFKRVL
ncbi:MAG: hypothetical protein ABIG28_02120 [archaeon]